MSLALTELYEKAYEHARVHDQARDFVMALQCHALCEGYARALYNMLPDGDSDEARLLVDSQRHAWRSAYTYHATSCQNIRKLVRTDDPLAGNHRNSDEVERAVWSVARSARGLLSNLRKDVRDMLPTAFLEGLEADLQNLDAAQLKQRKARGEV